MKKNTFDPFMINNFSNITKQAKSISIPENNSNNELAGMNFIEKSINIRTPKTKRGVILLIDSNSIGESNELGKKLIKDFVFSIADGLEFPEYILFVNTGVELLKDNELKENLKKIKKYGTNLVASYESIEFFGLTDEAKFMKKLSIGEIAMLTINANKVIKV